MPGKSQDLWSQSVTEHDRADALPEGVFKSGDPARIAEDLKSAAQDPKRASKNPYRSAMSMLDFYVNRAGRNLSAGERKALEKVKAALRKEFARKAD